MRGRRLRPESIAVVAVVIGARYIGTILLITRAGGCIERRQVKPGNGSIAVGICSERTEIVRCFNESSVRWIDDGVFLLSHDVSCVVGSCFSIKLVC